MGRDLRVLFLLTQSLDYPSGLGRYLPLARQMARLGYDVEIAALHPAWKFLSQRQFTQDGVTVSYVAQMHVYQNQNDLNQRHYFGMGQLLAVTAIATAALARTALISNADVIHIAKAQPMNGLAGWLSSRLGRKQLYLDCDDDEAASNRFGAKWQQRLVRWWEYHLPSAVKGITVNTTFLRDRCLQWGIPSNRIRWVPNGFDPDRFKPVSVQAIESVRQRWNLSGRPVVLYLGSLSLTNHPLGLLLDAFVEVRRAIPSTVLLIVGGGEDFKSVGQAIVERDLQGAVVLTGRVDPSEVSDIYAASQVSVDPVYDDDTARARSPLKIVESMAMGVPVVTGNTGDRAKMLDGGRLGVLVTPGNVGALADGIISILNNRVQYDVMAEQARQVCQQYRWGNLANEFVKIYSSI